MGDGVGLDVFGDLVNVFRKRLQGVVLLALLIPPSSARVDAGASS